MRKGTLTLDKVLFFIVCFIVLLLSLRTFFNIEPFIHADTVNEIAYKKMVADTGKILPDQWYHPAELHSNRLLLFFVPVYWITKNVLFAHQFAVVAAMLCQIFALIYLLKQFLLSKRSIFCSLILFLGCNSLSGFSFVYFDAYAGFVLSVLLTVGILQNLKNSYDDRSSFLLKSKWNLLKYLLLVFIAVYVGYGTPKLAVVLYCPYLLVEFIGFFKNSTNKQKVKFFFFLESILLICNGFSYIAFTKSGALYSPVPSIVLPLSEQLSWDNLSNILQSILFAMNLTPSGDLMSLGGVYYVGTMFVTIGLFLCSVFILKSDFLPKQKEVTRFTWISTVVLSLNLCILGLVGASPRYFFVLTIFLPVLFGIFYNRLLEKSRWKSNLLCTALVIISLFPSFLFRPLMASPSPTQNDIKACTEYVQDNHYDLATASYWNAGLMRFYSNWTLDVQQCYTFETPVPFRWICDASVFGEEYNQKKNVLMVNDEERTMCETEGLLQDSRHLADFGTMHLYELPESILK